MLSQEERREIDAERTLYPDPQAALADALKIVQRRHGWVTNEALTDVAEHFGLSPETVENVATFYNLIFRRPVGRHVILLCDSVSCWLMGYEDLYARLRTLLGVEFGGTTDDGRFTLLPMCCLGACDHAAVLMIDEDLYYDLAPDDLAAVLDRYEGGSAQ